MAKENTTNQLSMNFAAELIELVKRYEDNTDSHLYYQVVNAIWDNVNTTGRTKEHINFIKKYIVVEETP
jgi:hypothetical protein